jgi:hypothetical protein
MEALMIMRRKYTTTVGALLAAALLAAGCGGGESPLEIGFRRVALDLAFKDADKAPPAQAGQVIRQVFDVDYDYIDEEPQPEVRRVIRRIPPAQTTPKRECPVAPDGSTPSTVAFQTIKEPPKVGTYPRHNEGTITVELPTQTIELPVPPLSKWDIPRVDFVKAALVLNNQDEELLNPPAPARSDSVFLDMPEFEITRRLLTGYSTTDTFRYTYHGASGGDFLYLVKRVTVARGVERVFQPTPPIRYVRLNVPQGDIQDSGAVHAGIDRESNMALAVQSQIVDREFVDVCGEVVDTFKVQIQEQFVDLSQTPPVVSGNEGDTVNFWNIQFDNGLLIVREEVNSTLRMSTQVAGAPVPIVVRYRYITTLDKLDPDPLEARPDVPTFGGGGAGSADEGEETEVEE